MKVETLKDSYQLSSVQQGAIKGFWRQLLHGFGTSLVVDQAPQAPRQERVVLKSKKSIKASTSGLQSLAQQHQLTQYTVVQEPGLCFCGDSGEADVVFGASRACRHSSFAESGRWWDFAQHPARRVGVSPEMPLLPWLKQLQAEWLALETILGDGWVTYLAAPLV